MLLDQLKEDLHIENSSYQDLIIPKGYVNAQPFVDVLLELSEYNEWNKKKKPILKNYWQFLVNIICQQKGVNRIPNLIIGNPFLPQDMWIHPLILIEGLCQKNENLNFERLFFLSKFLKTKDYTSISEKLNICLFSRIKYNRVFFDELKKNHPNLKDFKLFDGLTTYQEVIDSSREIKKTPGIIYFLQESTTQNIRIGRTTNLEKRIKTIGGECAGEVELLVFFKTDDTVGIEKELYEDLYGLQVENKKKWYFFDSFLKDFLLLFRDDYPKELNSSELDLLYQIRLQMYLAYTSEEKRKFKLSRIERIYNQSN